MALVTLLVALSLERILGSLDELRRYDRFLGAAEAFLRSTAPPRPAVSVARLLWLVAPPVLGVAVMNYLLLLVWPPFTLLFGLFVLLHTFGRRDLEAEVEAYLDAWARGDEESAGWYAGELLGEMPPENGRLMTRALMEKVLVEAHERVLGVIFWFLVLGPAGAVLFRLASLLHERGEQIDGRHVDLARRLHALLAWAPVRLCALGFALSGSFVDAIHAWRDEASRWLEGNRGVLVASGFGALRYDPAAGALSGPIDWSEENHRVHETLALVRRTVLVWLALLGLFTVAGWWA